MENLRVENYLKDQSKLDLNHEGSSSGYFEENFDSISVFSTDSTVVDSEFAAQKVREFERRRSLENKLGINQAAQYNLHVDNIVIDSGDLKRFI
jgi:hypothetical protein